MAEKQNKKKSGGFGKWLLIAVIAFAAYFLKDCVPGFGWGGAAGDGTEAAASASGASSATPQPSASVTSSAGASASASAAPTTIVVKGDQCDGADCAETCKAALAKKGPVVVQGTEGSHAVVEALEKCLKEGGRKVSIQSE